jgi:hypothetical protein
MLTRMFEYKHMTWLHFRGSHASLMTWDTHDIYSLPESKSEPVKQGYKMVSHFNSTEQTNQDSISFKLI